MIAQETKNQIMWDLSQSTNPIRQVDWPEEHDSDAYAIEDVHDVTVKLPSGYTLEGIEKFLADFDLADNKDLYDQLNAWNSTWREFESDPQANKSTYIFGPNEN